METALPSPSSEGCDQPSCWGRTPGEILESSDRYKTSSKTLSSPLEMGSSRASCLEKGDTQLSV